MQDSKVGSKLDLKVRCDVLNIRSNNFELWFDQLLGVYIIYDHAISQLINDIKQRTDSARSYLNLIKSPELDTESLMRLLSIEGFQSLILEVTTACNMRCIYCAYSGLYKGFRTHGNNFMTREIAIRSVDMYSRYLNEYWISNPFREPVIGFYGGEPLLAFDLIKEVVEYSREVFKRDNFKPIYSITTNGTLVNEKIAEFLASNNFIVAVSLDGPKEIHDKCRRYINGKGTFNDVMKALNYLNAAYRKHRSEPWIIVECTIDPTVDLIKLRKFFNEISDKISALRISFVRPFSTRYYDKIESEQISRFNKDLNILRNEFVKYLLDGLYLKDRDLFLDSFFGVSLANVLIEPILFRHSLPFLKYGRYCIPGSKMYVTVNGDILLCERCSNELTIGDVLSGINLDKVLNIIIKFKEFQEKYCEHCVIRYSCPACYAVLYPFDERTCSILRQYVISNYMLLLNMFESCRYKLFEYLMRWIIE